MKIALVSIVKPQDTGGDIPTEYAYRLYEQMRKKNEVKLVYSLERVKKENVVGLVYTNTVFRSKIKQLAAENYEIIHITNQELGFASKILKVMGTNAKIITTIHDFKRFEDAVSHSGIMQQSYNFLVSSSINAAVKYSDVVIFTSSDVMQKAKGLFGNANFRYIEKSRNWANVAKDTLNIYKKFVR